MEYQYYCSYLYHIEYFFNGEIEIIPDNYKINLDFEQKEIIFREEVDNNYFINPSLIKMGDTLYSPFITSRKNTISLLKDFLNTPVKFSEQELSDYNILYAPDFLINAGGLINVYSELKGFSNNVAKNEPEIKESKKEKKGLAAFLKGKKFTYTLPGKKQINIFGSIVLGLNLILILLVILYLKNQEFHDFVFNVGR